MDKLVIEGGRPLSGQVTVSGSKNAALPMMAASLLTEERIVLHGVPPLSDVMTMSKILRQLGVRVEFDHGDVIIEPGRYQGCEAPYKLVSTMRGSFCVLGPLVARQHRARVSLPGGCVIGPRPVDLHLKGLRALGADVKIEHGDVVARAKRLRGTSVYLGGAFGSSVLGTANVMMAATLADGVTIIESAACEPEVVDLAELLNKMGARITGQGSPLVTIEGVRRLRGAEHTVIPDRIETGTYLMAAAMTKGRIEIHRARFDHLGAVTDKLASCGIRITHRDGVIHVDGRGTRRPADVTTLPYPGFPTDLQAQMMSLVAVTDGISVITEKIYPERFIHISELNRMGARISLEGASAIVQGVRQLSSAPVMASDLRASAALILAGLVAKGRTEVSRVYHLDRGYERMEEKLQKLGARIVREREE